jgi:dihydroorotate dehydrogenase
MEKGCKMKKLKILACLVIAAIVICTTPLWSYIRSSNLYWAFSDKICMPLLRQLDPEVAHQLSIKAVNWDFAPIDATKDHQSLQTTVWGIEFPNPIGLAAGFDKQALAMDGLLKLGFGFIEIGGVTPNPQPGNPKPRLFRLSEDQAIINRFGLNSDGQAVVAQRLAEFHNQQAHGIVGVNLAKNTTSNDLIGDYKKGIKNLGQHVDFIVLNVSCPNVAWTKELSKNGDEMKDMVCAVKKERDSTLAGLTKLPPLLMKLAPNMSEQDKEHMDGLVVANTTSERPESLQSDNRKETGGLSGLPVKAAALQTLKDMYRLTKGKMPIIGVGGIASGADVYERIRAGASLVEIYTALIYHGPGLLIDIKHDLAELLQRDGFASVHDAVGVDAKKDDV